MPLSSFAPFRKILAVAAVLLLAVGCSLHKANQAYDEGRYDDAVASYREVLRRDPSNTKARIGKIADKIAEGEHERFIIDWARFYERLEKKRSAHA